MTEIITGKDILANATYLPTILPEFLFLIDPDGTNVIQDKSYFDEGYLCNCLFKFVNETEPVEVTIYLTQEMFNKIVMEIDISKLTEIH